MSFNRGFYYDTKPGSPHIDTLSIGVNGSIAQFIDSEGRVGFGTSKSVLDARVVISGDSETPPLRLVGLPNVSNDRILTINTSGFVTYRSDIISEVNVTNNVITVENVSGGTEQFTINAITGGTYNNGNIVVEGSGNISNIGGIKTFYDSNGILNGNRVINTQNFKLTFSGSSNEQFKVIYTGNNLSDKVLVTENQGGINFYVTANGDLSANSKSFLIPNKTKPGHLLRHGSLEGPEHAVYFRGRLINTNKIMLPDYWEWLVDENTMTVQFTPIGEFKKYFVKSISSKEIEIFGEEIDCFFVVFGERKDIDKLILDQALD